MCGELTPSLTLRGLGPPRRLYLEQSNGMLVAISEVDAEEKYEKGGKGARRHLVGVGEGREHRAARVFARGGGVGDGVDLYSTRAFSGPEWV